MSRISATEHIGLLLMIILSLLAVVLFSSALMMSFAMAVTIVLLRNTRHSSSSLESVSIFCGSIFTKPAPDSVSKVESKLFVMAGGERCDALEVLVGFISLRLGGFPF